MSQYNVIDLQVSRPLTKEDIDKASCVIATLCRWKNGEYQMFKCSKIELSEDYPVTNWCYVVDGWMMSELPSDYDDYHLLVGDVCADDVADNERWYRDQMLNSVAVR